jgi:ATP-dependent exoDNAse (exonuclease V) alpha subunit
MSAPDWGEQQLAALTKIKAWLRDPRGKPVFKLFGYAGTGKTTLARYAVAESPRPVFTALSGKAAAVLREKGCPDAKHIHLLLYRCTTRRTSPQSERLIRTDKVVDAPQPITEKGDPVYRVEPSDELLKASVIVVDEASMINDDTVADLLALNKPILALGDPAQLQPPRGCGSLTQGEPDVFLSEIHRQARDNPIIQLSMLAREGKRLPRGIHGDSRVMTSSLQGIACTHADQVICGRHTTRHILNRMIRVRRGIVSGWPQIGERLVCLQNHSWIDYRLLNGSMWIVRSIATGIGEQSRVERVEIEIEPEGGGEVVTFGCPTIEFFTHFDFAYVLVCHKAQGSEWKSVVVVDEAWCWKARDGQPDQRKEWLYTAITRATERVAIVRLPWGRRP